MSKKKKKSKKTKFNTRRVCKAIRKSGGVKKTIADALGVRYNSLLNYLKTAPPIVLQTLKDELEYIGDIAEETLVDVAQQRLDLGSAVRSATTILKKFPDRGYVDQKELTLRGGRKVKNENVLDIDSLDLSLKDRKTLLQAIEDKEEKEKEEEDE